MKYGLSVYIKQIAFDVPAETYESDVSFPSVSVGDFLNPVAIALSQRLTYERPDRLVVTAVEHVISAKSCHTNVFPRDIPVTELDFWQDGPPTL